MASTNKTSNYNLSQYIGSDKPTYLGDYNGDMLKIDNAMHQNALDIATADEKATLAGTNANTALTNANNAQTTADTANTTANSALSKSTANETKILNMENGNVYSLNEVDTGYKWIDGKKIYRRVVEYNPASTIGATGQVTVIDVPHLIDNIDTCLSYSAKTISTTEKNVGMLPTIGGVGNNVTYGTNIIDFNKTNVRMRIINDTWGSASDFYFILEYTKTTD